MDTWIIVAIVVAVLAAGYAYKKSRRRKDVGQAPKPAPKPQPSRPTLPGDILVKPKSDVQGRGLTILLPRSQAGQYQKGTGYLITPQGRRYNTSEEYLNHHEHNRDILYWRETFSGEGYTLFWNGNAGFRFNPGVRSGS